MFPVEYREGEVELDSHSLACRPPDEVRAEDFVVAREGDGPSVVAARELLGGDISLRVTRHGARHDEREHVRVGAIMEFRETVQESHQER